MSAGSRPAAAGHFRPRMPIFWWVRKLPYIKFIARELTSVPVAYTVILLVVQFRALGEGPEAYRALQGWMASAPGLVVNVLAFFGLLFHSITWLGLAPKALVLYLGGKRVPDAAVIGGHYGAWLVASALVAWYLVRA